ncbi:MAG: response regulator [Anaerolineae bacterium]
MAQKILVVEDDQVLRETLAYNLDKEGYTVLTAEDGSAAVETTRREKPNLILLDLMLPGIDGLEVCRIVRRESSVPILILTARTDEVDRVVGLEIGADDYVTKPFSMRELLARIKAHLRRERLIRETLTPLPPVTRAADLKPPLSFDNLSIDLNRCEVMLDGDILPLKPKEYELLASLALHKGQVLSRPQLMQSVWGWDYSVDSRTVDVHIRWLRSKIEPDPDNPTRIVTVRGIGYRFEG